MTGNERIRILLIEDNPADANLLELFLGDDESAEFDLETAVRLQPGLEKLASDGFDVLLLDLGLPDSHGIETFHAAHAVCQDVPIVVLSGLTDQNVARTAVREGAEDYLIKGEIDEDSLKRSIRYALERMRRHEAERSLHSAEEQLRLARAIQRRLFPQTPPILAGFDIAGAAFPASETCGDYFDFVPMLRGRVGMVVGDVSGHGFGPALLMAESRAYLRALVDVYEDAAEILTRANSFLVHDTRAEHFVTLFLGCLSPEERLFEYAGAGHGGYLLDAVGNVRVLESTGLPLGLTDDAEVKRSESIELKPGDIILLPTDGTWEVRSADHEIYGVDRMLDVVWSNRDRPAKEIVRLLYEETRGFVKEAEQVDDITMIVLKINGELVND